MTGRVTSDTRRSRARPALRWTGPASIWTRQRLPYATRAGKGLLMDYLGLLGRVWGVGGGAAGAPDTRRPHTSRLDHLSSYPDEPVRSLVSSWPQYSATLPPTRR